MTAKEIEPRRWWNPENLKDVAESVGIANLSDAGIQALSEEVEYRVYMIIQEAKRFMHAGKRTVLHTTDISQALKVLEVEPLYGYESVRPLRFGEASMGQGQMLFYVEDEEVDFEKLINAPLPKVPRDMSFTAHWLAVEGVQPSIPQNPTTAEARAHELHPKGNPAIVAMSGVETPGFKATIKHVVSKEQRAWFDQVMSEILNEENTDDSIRRRYAAYQSIRDEPGTAQLLVYMVAFISEKITHHVKSLWIGRVMMDTVQAILHNRQFFLPPYVASLIPPIATVACVDRPVPDVPDEDYFSRDYELRRMAGLLLADLCHRHDRSAHHDLSLRAANTVLDIFTQPGRSLPSLYGAIVAYCALLPPEGVRSVFAPELRVFEAVLARARHEGRDADVAMVVAAIMEGLEKAERHVPPLLGESGCGGEPAVADDDVDGEARRARLARVVGRTVADKIIDEGRVVLERALLWDARGDVGLGGAMVRGA